MQSSVYGRARAVLQLSGEYSPLELKAAYRRAVRQAPPDRDPEAFRRVRAAYELLNKPLRGRNEWLLSNVPHCAPPLLHDSPARQPASGLGQVAFELLVRKLDIDELLPAMDLDSIIEEASADAGDSVDVQADADEPPADMVQVDEPPADPQRDEPR